MSRQPERILVPLDGSRLAESVLPSAFGLASALGARLVMLHVLERRPPTKVHGEPHLRGAREAEEYLSTVAERGRSAGVEVDTHVHETGISGVAGGIASHGRELGTGIIALCTHGSGGLHGLLLGSIALQTLRMGDASVLLVRPEPDGGAPPFGCRDVALAVDPVERHGRGALQRAAEVARACEGRVHLIAVVPTATSLPLARRATKTLLPSAMKVALDLEDRDAGRVLAAAAEELRGQGVESTSRVLRGEPVEQVTRALSEQRSDLLVLATHARAGIGGWLEGSFAARITGHIHTPLLMIRAVD